MLLRTPRATRTSTIFPYPTVFRFKIVLDACNPIAESAPSNVGVRYFTSLEDSLMERLQKEFQTTRFVKAFNSVGYQQLIDPQLADGPPTMFICGNDADAKRDVSDLLSGLGWEAADMGMAESARAIERSEEHTSELQSLMRI